MLKDRGTHTRTIAQIQCLNYHQRAQGLWLGAGLKLCRFKTYSGNKQLRTKHAGGVKLGYVWEDDRRVKISGQAVRLVLFHVAPQFIFWTVVGVLNKY